MTEPFAIKLSGFSGEMLYYECHNQIVQDTRLNKIIYIVMSREWDKVNEINAKFR